MEDNDSRLEEMMAGLRGQALHYVRQYVAVLARMRRDLMPSTRARMIKTLGWHLGPAHETGGAVHGERELEPAWLLHGTGWIMNKLATIRMHKQQIREEQFAAVQERLAAAEVCLVEKREAELRARVKAVKQRLPVVAAQLGLLWKTVVGMGRPTSSDMQLTATGSKMTMEEHVATAETHLGYTEGHLQPSDEHLADVEVHLKLV
jgi:hypothetical protein